MTMQPRISRISLIALAAASVTLVAQNASAQTDVKLQLPNAILLVDSSASMEFKAVQSPNETQPTYPICTPETPGDVANEASRWMDLIEVLTGTINDRRCESIPRTGEAFRSEYAMGSVNPPDYGFDAPFHRVMGGTCAPAPHPEAALALVQAPYSFPSGLGVNNESWLRFRPYNDLNSTCSTFTQATDGLLDTFNDTVRFSLMTFDGKKGPETGALSGGQAADFQGGVDGLWSYFVGASPAAGRPAGCSIDQIQEVGARNIFAPPWEGRMVILPELDGGDAEVLTTNKQVQDVLIASRPFGATPIAALLADARAYIYEEDGTWPADSGRDLGPKDDPYVNGGCRPQINILLTDGEPNMELRPYCEGIDGVCPYDESWETARIMAEDLPIKTKTFVIGFALPRLDITQAPFIATCDELTKTHLEGPTCAAPGSDALRTCCVLNRIAFNGGTDQAVFAENRTDLRQALSGALSTVVDKTTRTTPVVSAAGSAVGSRVFTEFVPQRFGLWDGVLQRERWECVSMAAEPQEVDAARGDDFVYNVNQDGGNNRKLLTVIGDLDGGRIYSERSIRPFASSFVDGVDEYSGTQEWFTSDGVDVVLPAAMSVDDSCDLPSAQACARRFMKWSLGTSQPVEGVFHRCPNGKCSLIAEIFHSTPTIVDSVPPDGIADETYERFIGAMLASDRPSTLYTSSNDGFFHAFDMDVTGPTNNELFAFIPPAVLPRIQSQYGGNRMRLLDGVPVIRDVAARVTAPNAAPIFERAIGDADTGTWRTVALQGFGASRGGYFALDVTEPERTSAKPNSGPRFLWQLTTSEGETPLFGELGATPLITTLFVKDNGQTREVPVAVLPGGNASPVPGPCAARSVDDHLSTVIPGTKIQCYGKTLADYAAQSLTIVRLDTGKILRTFRHAEDPNIGVFGALAEASEIRSPMTGTPVAYPGRTGAVADRIFLGDRDGTMWRLNTAEPDPKDWKLQIFFDAYANHSDPSDRQPIVTAPVLSVTKTGDVTVAFATGDQEVVTATTGMTNYIYSLTEERDGRNVKSVVNWFESFDNGERVTGPLAIFNEAVFFSSFAPQPADGANPCKPGDSRIWGMHYVTPEGNGGGLPMLPANPQNPSDGQVIASLPSSAIVGSANADRAVIFGVTVAQQPTCQSAPEEQQLEGYFGFTSGTFTSSTAAVKGSFELVVDAGAAGRGRMGLAPPRTPVVIDSWVGLTE